MTTLRAKTTNASIYNMRTCSQLMQTAIKTVRRTLTKLDGSTGSQVGCWKVHELLKKVYTEIVWLNLV